MDKEICPYCEAKREIIEVESDIKIKVDGKYVEVKSIAKKCTTCEQEFEDMNSSYDILAEAYKKRHGRDKIPLFLLSKEQSND